MDTTINDISDDDIATPPADNTDTPDSTDTPDYSDPTRYRVLSNGAIASVETGKIVKGNAANPLITVETARDYHVYRERKRQQAELAAQHGLARIVPGSPSALKAWAEIVEAQARQAKSGKAHSDANARFVGQATGFLVDARRQAPIVGDNAKIQVNVLGRDLAQSLLQQLAAVGGMLDVQDSDSE